MPFQTKYRFLTKISRKKNPIQNRIKKCSRMILVMTLQHACSGSLQHLKFLSLAAHRCHQWARSQLIFNHRILSESSVSIKKTDQVQRHLFKINGFSKLGRKSTGTPLIHLLFRHSLRNHYLFLEFAFNPISVSRIRIINSLSISRTQKEFT